MNEIFKRSIIKIIGHIKTSSTTRTLIYQYSKADDNPSSERRAMKLVTEDIVEVLGYGGFTKSWLNFKLYYGLNDTDAKCLNALKGKTLSEEEVAFIKQIVEGDNSEFVELTNQEDKTKKQALNSIEEILKGREPEEIEVAKNILNNDNDFKYKTDKVKAFISGGVKVGQIVAIMNLRKETTVTMSYVETIKKGMI